jgi:two-component system cell cycle response regulator DivK
MSFDGIKTVVIDDKQSDIVVIQRLLYNLGVECDVLINVSAVDELRNSAPPHVIFLDLEMPGKNGYDLLNEINILPELEGVPVVAYTAHQSHMPVARDAGFHSFLGKPLRSSEFSNQLARILNGEQVWEIRE